MPLPPAPPLQATNQAHIRPCSGNLNERLGPACMPSCGGTSGLHAPSVGSASGTHPALPFGPHRGGSGSCLPSCGSISDLGPALLCIQGVNALGLAALALSASLAGSMLAVPLARAGAAPTTASTPPCSCTSASAHLIGLTLAFSATPVSPRGPILSTAACRSYAQVIPTVSSCTVTVN